ncbi:MAG: glycosyltransferase family 1 protein [Gammaproteobacteria bacterium]|nr:glycosyltransferase family 1 protein [Gammaproteobacteria bacterium]MBU1624004.1 glycosyltransferase family 1 protein [Gammaproteobacteria bacterium]MBU1981732.1 glycosyltransferase family 1 protein [Gammaproteobacteria bacterium]
MRRPLALILSGGETATTDYFLLPQLESLGYEVILAGSGAHLAALEGCRLAVISRYVSGSWFPALERLRRQGAKLVYFMDDDLFDLTALQGLPWRYRWKIFSRAWMHRSRLLRLCDEFWVSTPYLAEKYAGFNPILRGPLPSDLTLAQKPCVRVCYHGTASHPCEIEWLLPIIREVQARTDDVHFELFGGREVAKRFGGLPRVSVLHPMGWQNYLAYTASHRCDIALAPLLPGAFNAARGPTKFYDYTRMEAAGLYSDVTPYRGFVREGVDGLLLDNDPERWIEAILALTLDAEKRAALAVAARQRLLNVIHTDSK